MSTLVIALIDGEVPPGVTVVARVIPEGQFRSIPVNSRYDLGSILNNGDNGDVPLTVKYAEAGLLLGGVSAETVKRMVREGELPYVKVGARRQIARSDIERYIETHRHDLGNGDAA